MRRRFCWAVVTALGLGAFGCGSSDVCSKGQTAYNNYLGCDSNAGPWNNAQCEVDIGSCSSTDQQALSAYLACVNNVGVCQPQNITNYGLAINACTTPAVSSACKNAVQPLFPNGGPW